MATPHPSGSGSSGDAARPWAAASAAARHHRVPHMVVCPVRRTRKVDPRSTTPWRTAARSCCAPKRKPAPTIRRRKISSPPAPWPKCCSFCVPDGTVKVLVEGKRRTRIRRFLSHDEHLQVEIEEFPEPSEDPTELQALLRQVRSVFENYVKLNRRILPELVTTTATIDDPARLADTISASLTALCWPISRHCLRPSLHRAGWSVCCSWACRARSRSCRSKRRSARASRSR